MFKLSDLITDRTPSDLTHARELARKGWANLTAAERTEWRAGLRAGGGAGYLNRLGAAINYCVREYAGQREELEALMEELGVAHDVRFSPPYDPAALDFDQREDWVREDVPTPDELAEILAHVAMLHSCFQFEADPLPESMRSLTLDGANAIERVLFRAPTVGEEWLATTMAAVQRTADAWNYSGELLAGDI